MWRECVAGKVDPGECRVSCVAGVGSVCMGLLRMDLLNIE